MYIKIDKELCTGCGKCEDICTTGALTISKETKKAEYDKYRCVGCGLCVIQCSNRALRFE